MSAPDFDQMATSLYDAMGRGPEADIKCIAAALRLARAQAIEEAAGVAALTSEDDPLRCDFDRGHFAGRNAAAVAIRTLATP